MRERRRRRLSWYLIWFVILFFSAAVLITIILSLPVWRIKDVRIEGASIVSSDHLQGLALPLVGENIFLADYSGVKDKVGAICQIKDFGIFRALPGTVRIRIVERRPFAVVIARGFSVVIDEEGYLLFDDGKGPLKDVAYLSQDKGMGALPVVRAEPARDASGMKLDESSARPMILTIKELLRFLPSSTLQLEIKSSDNLDLIVEDILKVRFGGISDISAKIAVLEALLPELEGKWNDIVHVDIRVAGNPVVLFKKNKNT